MTKVTDDNAGRRKAGFEIEATRYVYSQVKFPSAILVSRESADAVTFINEKWTYIPRKSLMRLDKTMDTTDF